VFPVADAFHVGKHKNLNINPISQCKKDKFNDAPMDPWLANQSPFSIL
jgi:hypothetical protein